MAKAAKGNSEFKTQHDGSKQLGRDGGSKAAKQPPAFRAPARSTGANVSSFNGASGVGKKLTPTLIKAKTDTPMAEQMSGKPAGGTDNKNASHKQLRAGPLSVPFSGSKRQPAEAFRADGKSTPKSVAKAPKVCQRAR